MAAMRKIYVRRGLGAVMLERQWRWVEAADGEERPHLHWKTHGGKINQASNLPDGEGEGGVLMNG